MLLWRFQRASQRHASRTRFGLHPSMDCWRLTSLTSARARLSSLSTSPPSMCTALAYRGWGLGGLCVVSYRYCVSAEGLRGVCVITHKCMRSHILTYTRTHTPCWCAFWVQSIRGSGYKIARKKWCGGRRRDGLGPLADQNIKYLGKSGVGEGRRDGLGPLADQNIKYLGKKWGKGGEERWAQSTCRSIPGTGCWVVLATRLGILCAACASCFPADSVHPWNAPLNFSAHSVHLWNAPLKLCVTNK